MRLCLHAEFPATHRIRIDSRGTLEPSHAHNWRVDTWLEVADGNGESVRRARAFLNDWVARFDGNCFNDVPPFDHVNPTAEEVARVLSNEFPTAVPEVNVLRVEIGEAAGFSAIYWNDN